MAWNMLKYVEICWKYVEKYRLNTFCKPKLKPNTKKKFNFLFYENWAFWAFMSFSEKAPDELFQNSFFLVQVIVY